MPVRFLTDAVREQLSEFPAELDSEALDGFFTFSDVDLAEISRRHGDGNRLGWALHLSGLRLLGFCPADVTGVPPRPTRAYCRFPAYIGRPPYARARGLTAEEVARLLAAIPVESAAGLRLRALVLAYLLTGRRRCEVLNLRWRDLDLEGGFYRYSGKGGKERQRALPPPVRLAILVYAEAAGLARKPEQAGFPGRWRDQPVDGKYIGEQLRQAAELAGIPLERPLHTLRHSYARALRRIEVPLEAVQAALDHSNLSSATSSPPSKAELGRQLGHGHHLHLPASAG